MEDLLDYFRRFPLSFQTKIGVPSQAFPGGVTRGATRCFATEIPSIFAVKEVRKHIYYRAYSKMRAGFVRDNRATKNNRTNKNMRAGSVRDNERGIGLRSSFKNVRVERRFHK